MHIPIYRPFSDNLEVLYSSFLQADKARKDAQSESQENADRLKDLHDQFNSLNIEKRRIEGDLMSLQSELKDFEDEVRAAQEKASKAESEVPHLISFTSSTLRHIKAIFYFINTKQ